MNIALVGPPGVGKGTHADKLVTAFDLHYFVTRDVLRENLRSQTALGILARKYMNRGELVPDEVVEAMVEEWLLKTVPQKGILFDGFPRTRYQAAWLDTIFKKMNQHLDAVIYLKVSDAKVARRLLGRLICDNCQTPYHLKYKPPQKEDHCDVCDGNLYRPEDDNEDMVNARLRTFHRTTASLARYYQQTNRLMIIDGEGKIDQISTAIVDAVTAVQRQEKPSASAEESQAIQSLRVEPKVLTPEQVTHISLDIVLFGAPGSGKGTQAEYLKTELNLPHIATGDIFRANLKNETELGKLAKTYMDRGDLVPDDVTEAMIRDRIARPDIAQGFILDGFPRTLSQAEALTEIMTDLKRRLDAVLHIKVADEEIVRRLSGRLICRDCQTPYHLDFNPPTQEGICDKCSGELYRRDDDNPETVRSRLKTFKKQTAPLIEYYRQANLLIEIEGEGDINEINNITLTAITKLIVV